MELDGVVKKSYVPVPPEWSVHKKKEFRGDRGLTLSQSQLLYRLTSVLVPVASRKSNFFSSSISIPVLNLACFGVFMVLILLFPAICKQCRLFLTKESKSFDTSSMPTVSTEVIAEIPQEVKDERKGNLFPSESAKSDPVSLMAERTSTSFMLFILIRGLRRWQYCNCPWQGNIFAPGKAGLVSILLATAPLVNEASLPKLCQELPREFACRLQESLPYFSPPQACFGVLTIFCAFLSLVYIHKLLCYFFFLSFSFALGKRKHNWTVSGIEKLINCDIG